MSVMNGGTIASSDYYTQAFFPPKKREVNVIPLKCDNCNAPLSGKQPILECKYCGLRHYVNNELP